MKTIKVSFDYEGQHYDLKLQIRVKHNSETGYALTKRDYNDDWELINYNERDCFIAAYYGDGYTFELKLSWRDARVLHLLIWPDSNDMYYDEGSVENYNVSESDLL